jgi:hypothetical protein
MSQKYDPRRGRWSLSRISKQRVFKGSENGIPIAELSAFLKREGYYVSSEKALIRLLPSLGLEFDSEKGLVYVPEERK